MNGAGMAKRSEARDRRARAAALQAAQRRAERRRTMLIIGACAAVAVVILGAAAFALVDQQRQQDDLDRAASASLTGVEDFDDLSRSHVDTTVDYPQTPPVGGDHSQVWTNCGVYDSPVDAMQTTHSLEHGAVWVGYDPTLEEGQVEALTMLAQENDYVVLSPVDGVRSPITVSAWGTQLELDRADDPRLRVFLEKYQQGSQAPEPGAACTGGVGGS